jgi:hypothetical protein
MNIKNNNLYSTADLGLATILDQKYSIHHINRDNPKKIVFIFQKDEDFDSYLDKYWNSELRVDPLKYYQHLKLMKSRIYGG